MNKRIAPVVFTAFVIASVVCAILWRNVRRMEAENKGLRVEIKALADSAEAHAREVDRGRARGIELESQQRELLRLRNEVSQLRASRDAARRVEQQVARTGADGGRAGTRADGESIPTEDWKFAGYETPQAALISAMWAMKEGQLAELLNTFTPDERQRFESQPQGKSPTEIAQRFQKEYGRVTGLRALAQHELEPGKVMLDVYLEGTGKLKKYTMEQVNGEWKSAGPTDQNRNASTGPAAGNGMAFYMQNPELMQRYFPQMYKMMQEQKQQGAEQATGTVPQ